MPPNCGEDSGLPIQIELVSSYPAQPFDADCVDAVRARGREAGLLQHAGSCPAPATTRSTWRSSRPAGMIFIPCKDGISHNEIEDAKPEHITAGCNVLLHAMLERAGV